MPGPNRTKSLVSNEVFRFPLNQSKDQVLQHSGIQPKDLKSVTKSVETAKGPKAPLGSTIQPNELEDFSQLLEDESSEEQKS